MDFKFDHSYLSLPELQSLNIRSTKWLEESFYDSLGRMIEINDPTDVFPVFASFGFCNTMLPVLYIFRIDDAIEEVVIHSQQARVMTREEIHGFIVANEFVTLTVVILPYSKY